MKKLFAKITVVCCIIAALGVGAFAVDATMVEVTGALSTGFTGIAGQAMNVIALIIPIALGIVGAVFVIKRGVSWFQSLSHK